MIFQHSMVCVTCFMLLVLCALLNPWLENPEGLYAAVGAAVYFGARSSTYLLKKKRETSLGR